MTVSHRGAGKTLQARVSETLPQFDAASRTLNVRLETENPDYQLKPDMFVDVEFSVQSTPALMVPSEAVLDTGMKKTVFVETSSGVFEPRRVHTGARFGDSVEITEGLADGERVVVEGNFLLDSESHLRLGAMAPASMAEQTAAAKDPVCGMNVDRNAPSTLKVQDGGKTYYFCAETCRKSFATDPRKYAAREAVQSTLVSRLKPGPR